MPEEKIDFFASQCQAPSHPKQFAVFRRTSTTNSAGCNIFRSEPIAWTNTEQVAKSIANMMNRECQVLDMMSKAPT